MFLIGNLAEEPKTSMTTGGATKCSFRLAVQRRFTNQQTGQREADFIPIVAWRQTGELCAKYLTKGRKCAVCGSIQTRSYDAKDGGKRYVTEIIADEVQFLGSPARQQGGQTAQGETPDGFTAVEDDELPF
ncbi:MAG: single-stranded DNA-binding protein [Christensenellales bacterium]|nr:single-stranded DNA-binding protein [Christensenellales bacterium]